MPTKKERKRCPICKSRRVKDKMCPVLEEWTPRYVVKVLVCPDCYEKIKTTGKYVHVLSRWYKLTYMVASGVDTIK
jgi:hypothetical protein